MRIVYFTHSLRSCWNHGNAHFLRGVLSELAARGHEVVPCEPATNWSLDNLIKDAGASGLADFERAYPALKPVAYRSTREAAGYTEGADLVIVHEWNEPALVAALGALRRDGASFTLLFHDTHHRAVSEPQAIGAFDLDGYDGVLAFGERLSDVYRDWGWGDRVFTWHEAADINVFHPQTTETQRSGLVWIGNWGDGERSEELEHFLLRPAQEAGMALDIYGVRYPAHALDMLRAYGASYHGWLPNARTPQIFAQHLATVHVPRRFYRTHLPGIPTIRVFEALACGIPLVCAPWEDSEGLFTTGQDYLVAEDGVAMTRQLMRLRDDAALRQELAQHGLATIRKRHTCAHRVEELLGIVARLRQKSLEPQE
jgi:spore maturation protein CgeB